MALGTKLGAWMTRAPFHTGGKLPTGGTSQGTCTQGARFGWATARSEKVGMPAAWADEKCRWYGMP